MNPSMQYSEEELNEMRRTFDEYQNGLRRCLSELYQRETTALNVAEVMPGESCRQTPPVIYEEKPETWRDRPPLL